jgi:acyl-coenzyme A thioesterase PaaI-like protein
MPRYRLGSPLPGRSTLREGRKPTLTGLGAVTICKHNYLRSLPVQGFALRLVAKVLRRGTTPGVVHPAQP